LAFTWSTAIQRKKIFEYLRNCSKRNFGRNDKIEYLLVLIWFVINFVCCGPWLIVIIRLVSSFIWVVVRKFRVFLLVFLTISPIWRNKFVIDEVCTPIAKKKAHVPRTNRRKVNVPRWRDGIFILKLIIHRKTLKKS